ncbi:MAG TPA: hypothetical protein VFT95_08655 [Micromonosporaceae bacterium]|nr:hypothetical protein [Micromonosporaceae bacterium]
MTVSPPSFDASPYGLLSVVEARYDEPDPHWRSGVQWQPLCGDVGSTYDPCLAVTGTGGVPPLPPAKTSALTYEARGATPFTVYARFDCSPAASAEEAERQAQDAMTRLESWQVERSFWTGMSGGVETVFPHLAADAEVRDAYGTLLQTAADPITGSAVNIVEAFGQVEKALADCFNGAGVIHVPAELGAAVANAALAKPDGRRLKTLNGNWVAVGNGYPGTSPAGATPAAGTAWIYGTGPVFAYRSRVEIPSLPSIINRRSNSVEALAERTYVLGFGCCLAAALVDVGGET